MNTFCINLVNELQRQASKKKTFVLLAITAAIPAGAAAAAGFFQGGLGIMPLRGSDFPAYMLGIFMKYLLPLFIFMTTADIFAGELHDRSIKAVFLRPATRLSIFVSKVACGGAVIISHLAVLFVFSSISGLLLGGGSTTSILSSAALYCAAFLPLLMVCIISCFISLISGGSSGSIVISVLVFLAAGVVSVLAPGISGYLFTSAEGWHMMLLSGTVPAIKILSVFMVMFSYSIIFLSAGYLLFEKKEV